MKKVEKNSLGYRIRFARDTARLTQEYLAKKLGVAKRTLIKWEQNESKPKDAMVKEIAHLTQFPLNEILAPSDPLEGPKNEKGNQSYAGDSGEAQGQSEEYRFTGSDKGLGKQYNQESKNTLAEDVCMLRQIVELQTKLLARIDAENKKLLERVERLEDSLEPGKRLRLGDKQ